MLINMGELNTKIDVYAYKVILMEIIARTMVSEESLHDAKVLVPIFPEKHR
jgi:hypothetical protein